MILVLCSSFSSPICSVHQFHGSSLLPCDFEEVDVRNQEMNKNVTKHFQFLTVGTKNNERVKFQTAGVHHSSSET